MNVNIAKGDTRAGPMPRRAWGNGPGQLASEGVPANGGDPDHPRFARARLKEDISGFSFLKRDSADSMVGAWWSSEHEISGSESPPKFEGVPAKWERLKDSDVADWAAEAFGEVEREGLASYFARIDAASRPPSRTSPCLPPGPA
jgi:hypothetical protein